MANEPSGIRQAREHRDYGERIALLEDRYGHLLVRIDHLDECVDSVKEEAVKNTASIHSKLSVWDKRMYIGIGLILGMIAAAGNWGGLKWLIELFSK